MNDNNHHGGDEGDPPGSGRPDCPHCAGLGYVVPDVAPTDPTYGRAIPCSCRASDLEFQHLERLQKLSQLGALQNNTFETFLPEGHGMKEGKQRNLRMAFDAARKFAAEPRGWLVLKGAYGCGKTHLAAAIANHQINLGRPVLFINTPDLLDHLRAAYAPFAETGFDERFDQIRNARLLILDDLGSQSNTPWAQEKLYQIFNHRYNARLPTVVTTNEELEAIDIRIRSRLVDMSFSHILHILAPDFRQSGVDQNQSDLSSLNSHLAQTFESFDMREDSLTKSEQNNLQRAYEAAVEYAQEPAGWLVYSSVATVNGQPREIYWNGKTHLAAAIANYRSNLGEPALFVTVIELLDHLRATFDPASSVRLDRRFGEIKNAPLLILDALGTESATPWAREKLYQLFDHRFSNGLPTVITTATRIDQLDQKLAARMMDRDRCRIISLEVPSFRGHSAPPPRRRRRS